ncbi:MAG TPA: hypothetical protein PLD88_03355, partial [Candidatus Berkiella sp.]|nr:hypothetical protein [Candidatus Berkiella sp.]
APAIKKVPAIKASATKKGLAKTELAPKAQPPMTEKQLQQHFMQSLEQLEKYWHKKVDSLKKQAEHAKLFPDSADIQMIRDDLDEAINQANKYSALQDMIIEFEQDWTSQTMLANT